MKKTFLAVVVSAAALLMAGCGSDQTDRSGDTPAEQQTDQPAGQTDEQPTDRPAAQSQGDPSSDGAVDVAPSGEGKSSVAGAVGSSLFKAITGGEEEKTSDEAPSFQQ